MYEEEELRFVLEHQMTVYNIDEDFEATGYCIHSGFK